MENKHKHIWIVVLVVASFVVWKLSTLQFRFGDENVYFYMSDAVLRGLVPYKDFFYADPPFFIYLMAGFKAFFGSHIILFKILPILFDSASAVLIYLLLRKNNVFAVLAPALYLFSFTVISTSDYVTGAEIMIFLMLMALLFDQNKKHYWSGVFWALACLCKLYAGPALLGFLFYKLISKEFLPIRNIILGGLGASILILLPFFILAPHQALNDLIIHHLHRPLGIDKLRIFGVFFSFEWLMVISAIAGIFIAKNKIWAYPLLFSVIFFLLYRDLYYMYLHLLMPFIAILAVEFLEFLNKKKEEFSWSLIAFFIFVASYSIYGYVNIYAPQGIFREPQEIAEALKNAPENLPAYGSIEMAPLVALMSGKKIFDNVMDTSVQNFASGGQNLSLISEKAAKSGVYLVTRVANYPEQNIKDTGFEGYFDKKVFDSSCALYKSFDRISPDDPLNQVAIYKCYNP
mgnify:CR=1 FL=1